MRISGPMTNDYCCLNCRMASWMIECPRHVCETHCFVAVLHSTRSIPNDAKTADSRDPNVVVAAPPLNDRSYPWYRSRFVSPRRQAAIKTDVADGPSDSFVDVSLLQDLIDDFGRIN